MRLTQDILKLAFYPGEAQKLAAYTDPNNERVFDQLFPTENGNFNVASCIHKTEYLGAVRWIHIARNILIVSVALVALTALAAAFTAIRPLIIVGVGALSIISAFSLFKELSVVDRVLKISEPNNIMHTPDYLAFRA